MLLYVGKGSNLLMTHRLSAECVFHIDYCPLCLSRFFSTSTSSVDTYMSSSATISNQSDQSGPPSKSDVTTVPSPAVGMLCFNGIGEDPTKLMETVTTTEVFGLVPLLYCLLLDPGNRSVPVAATSTAAATAPGIASVMDQRMPTSAAVHQASSTEKR